MFTDLATGRHIFIEATEDTDEWWVTMPDLVIGHAYLIQLTIGVNPVEFYPYVLTAGTFVSDTTLRNGAIATVTKFWEPGGETYYTSNDQYLNIP